MQLRLMKGLKKKENPTHSVVTITELLTLAEIEVGPT